MRQRGVISRDRNSKPLDGFAYRYPPTLHYQSIGAIEKKFYQLLANQKIVMKTQTYNTLSAWDHSSKPLILILKYIYIPKQLVILITVLVKLNK